MISLHRHPATINAANTSRTEEGEAEQNREREREDNGNNKGGVEERNRGDMREGKKTAATYTTTPAISSVFVHTAKCLKAKKIILCFFIHQKNNV